jgi:hypothetical protein
MNVFGFAFACALALRAVARSGTVEALASITCSLANRALA